MTFPGPGGLAVSESHPGTGDTPGQSLDLELGMFGEILFPQTLLNEVGENDNRFFLLQSLNTYLTMIYVEM